MTSGNNTPNVSVIVPVYNGEKYIGHCLEKLLRQSLKDLEIICVNDGSTDKTLKIVQEYSERDSRIKLIDKINQGPGPARNAGLKLASGEFVAFMDADDFFHDDDVLEKLYELARQHNVKICGGAIKIITHKNIGGREITEISFNRFAASGLTNYINCQQSTGFSRYIYNRQFILDNNIFFPTLRRGQDYIWFTKAQLAAKNFWAADFIVYVYMLRQKSGSFSYNTMLEGMEAETRMLRLASENNLNAISRYHQKRLGQSIRNLILSDPDLAEIAASYKISCIKYYFLKLLSKTLPGKWGRAYRAKFLSFKAPFDTVRHNKLY